MEISVIKKRLIDEINQLNNPELLEELCSFLNLENKMEDAYILSREQEAAIEESREQIKNGDYLTDEQANDDIDRWLEE